MTSNESISKLLKYKGKYNIYTNKPNLILNSNIGDYYLVDIKDKEYNYVIINDNKLFKVIKIKNKLELY